MSQPLSDVSQRGKLDFELDVLVLGGGITGLLCAVQAADRGYRTVLVERNERLGGGASTRNEGWIHAGTYHAQAIENESSARLVTQSTLYGHHYFLREAPEDISSLWASTIAVTQDAERAKSIERRWNEFGVKYERLPKNRLRKFIPTLNIRSIGAAFLVEDFSIDTTKLLERFLHRLRRAGGLVQAHAEIVSGASAGDIVVRTADGSEIHLFPRVTVVACGTGNAATCKQVWNVDIQQGFYKSHLVVARPVNQAHSIFSLDGGGPTIMVHGAALDLTDARYVIGTNRDSERLEQPNHLANARVVSEMIRKAENLLGFPLAHTEGYACVKTDLARKAVNTIYDLAPKILEPKTNLIVCVPGKMTEAPTVSRLVFDRIWAMIGPPHVSLRPLDQLVLH